MMNLRDYLMVSNSDAKAVEENKQGQTCGRSDQTDATSCHDKNAWEDEKDFSDWLKDNLAPLNSALEVCPGEMEIVTPKREYELSCGYKVDIYAGLKDTDDKVVIENQFGESDHRHLGQILAYSIEADAKHIIWNIEKASDTHAKIVKLLNEDGFNGKFFYLVEMKLNGESKSDRSAEFKLKEGPCDDSTKKGPRGDSTKEGSRTNGQLDRMLELINKIC